MRIRLVTVMGMALLLGACNSGGGGGSAGTVNGSVVKGPVVNATINVFRLQADGTQGERVAGPITSGADGHWSADLSKAGSGPFLIVSSGGTFLDEATRQTVAAPALTSIMPANDGSAADLPITPLTDALARRVRQQAPEGQLADVIQAAQQDFRNAFSFDPLSVMPSDPLHPDAGDSEAARQYAAVLGGISHMAQGIAPNAPKDEAVVAIAEDLSDLRLDGYSRDGRRLNIDGSPMPAMVSEDATGLNAYVDDFLQQYRDDNNQADFPVADKPVVRNRRGDAPKTNLNAALDIRFTAIDVPQTTQAKDTLQTTAGVTLAGNAQTIGFSQLMKVGAADNGEIFGQVKDYQGNGLTFNDGSAYVCQGTNDGVGSGPDHASILQRNDKLYMVTQFECSVGAMYMQELDQDPLSGALSARPNTLRFIDQSSEFGGFTHCAGVTTPWQSHLGSEEYEVDARAIENGGSSSYYSETDKFWGGDAGMNSPYYYNWTPEVKIDDAGDPQYTKHYAMGRFSHELAYVMPDKRTVYLSDDGTNVGLYLFVADKPEDLSAGTLYAARFTQLKANRGGSFSLQWINLGHATNSDIRAMVAQKPLFSDLFDVQTPTLDNQCGTGFTAVNTANGAECLKVKSGMEIYASRLETRRYAALMGATTELRKEEGIAYDPVHNKLYIAISEIAQGMEDNAKYGVANDSYDKMGRNDIRLPDNTCGAVYALDMAQQVSDSAAAGIASPFVASNFYAIVTGEPKDYVGTAFEGNSCNVDRISEPDNLSYIANSNLLLIGEDSGGHQNNAVWSYDVETGELRRIATTPLGAEATSPYWYQDLNGFSYATLVTQHPGTGDRKSFVGVLGPVQNAAPYVLLASDKASCEQDGNRWNDEAVLCHKPDILRPDYDIPGPGDVDGEKPACYETDAAAGLVFKSTFECGSLLPWKAYSAASNADWEVSSYGGRMYAYISGYAADEPSEDWLISPRIDVSGNETLRFETAKGYSGSDLVLKISTDYTGSGAPAAATWSDLPATWSDSSVSNYQWTASGAIDLSAYAGQSVYFAFYHQAPGTASGQVANWEIDNVIVSGGGSVVVPFEAEIAADQQHVFTGLTAVSFSTSISGGMGPYTTQWDMGDGSVLTDATVTHTYAQAGNYTVTLTVTDANSATTTQTFAVTVQEPDPLDLPAKVGDLRVATFNAYLNRPASGDIKAELQAGTNPQIRNVAHIIQLVNPDVVLINELDYEAGNAELFKQNFLEVAQGDAPAVSYPYVYEAPVNTGVQPFPSVDFNNDGQEGGADDAYGFGEFAGQYGMIVLSRFPIDNGAVRTFQNFLWKDMTDGLLATIQNPDATPYYSTEEQAIFRLSSKSHWDVPVEVNGSVVHLLGSHPTPPTFDGTEDRNGKRNHDEIRLWKDYVENNADYLYDDNGQYGGLPARSRFVIVGDQNADANEGDSYDNAILQLLDSAAVNSLYTPVSEGAMEDGLDADDTADWGMHADYVLPSAFGFNVEQGGVFWPKKSNAERFLVEKTAGGLQNSSDHRMVWLDLSFSNGLVTLSQNFNDDTLGDWTAYSVASNKDWAAASYAGDHYAKASGYGGDVHSDDWLISPPVNFTGSDVLTFRSASNYSGPQLQVLVSSDYTGSGDPSAATWTGLSATLSPGSWAWTESGDIDLSAYHGVGHIAFRYTSDAGGAATWELDDIQLKAANPVIQGENFEDGTLGTWAAISLASDKDWQPGSYQGDRFARINGYNGNEYSNDWLVSPAFALGGNISLDLRTAANYSGPALKVLLSTDYDGAGDPGSAQWTELPATLSTGSWVFTDSGSIDLSSYSGIGHIGIQYVSDETGAAGWEVDDLVIQYR